MTRPHADASRLRGVRPWEYALRFAFGGAIAVICGLAGAKLGASYGGMLMTFPAIMPASLTLVKRHDGRACAEQDARGGRLGAVALAAFAGVVAVTAGAWSAPLVLAAATAAWLAVAVAAWLVAERRRARRS